MLLSRSPLERESQAVSTMSNFNELVANTIKITPGVLGEWTAIRGRPRFRFFQITGQFLPHFVISIRALPRQI